MADALPPRPHLRGGCSSAEAWCGVYAVCTLCILLFSLGLYGAREFTYFTTWGLTAHVLFGGLLVLEQTRVARNVAMGRSPASYEPACLFWGAPVVHGVAWAIWVIVTVMFRADPMMLSRLYGNMGASATEGLPDVLDAHLMVHFVPLGLLCGVLVARADVLAVVFQDVYLAETPTWNAYWRQRAKMGAQLFVVPSLPLLIYRVCFSYAEVYKTHTAPGLLYGTAAATIALSNGALWVLLVRRRPTSPLVAHLKQMYGRARVPLR